MRVAAGAADRRGGSGGGREREAHVPGPCAPLPRGAPRGRRAEQVGCPLSVFLDLLLSDMGLGASALPLIPHEGIGNRGLVMLLYLCDLGSHLFS